MGISQSDRCRLAERLAREAGGLGLEYFGRLDRLAVESKGHQDVVSEADKALERHIRAGIAEAFPDDGIVGEEGDRVEGGSGYIWVIDPIDGTANFVSGIPAWTVVIALVHESRVIAGFIHDPVMDEMYRGYDGEGAWCNDAPLKVAHGAEFTKGSVGVGFSNRSKAGFVEALIASVLGEGGVFFRNASGALSLAYVAAGKLLGYSEDHMNAWDYLAGQLLVREAGGGIEAQDIDDVLARGGRVVAAAPGVFPRLLEMTETAMEGDSRSS